ncbi:hypothetical protein MBM_04613 [Drepanopeziza brunnea f. sp. 'multigermtubi' MB_m1]|uniref:Uncharacterized protein n=1 Tax=Marssonina brunnea f. sp. multigermtubi (strain MB_m1) TaxID=1072389 RepID=K1WVG3_MARBU|nr:uncharacterized protein MBM_04613 [Drepanopeziza brunnea f. sp. 'multigermtubi' MB_m1]EKD17036.1 hypothetical protein MBM_04613 [Drepanopeziza brunnea f. sp. 'multigermtubi' MB_m1]
MCIQSLPAHERPRETAPRSSAGHAPPPSKPPNPILILIILNINIARLPSSRRPAPQARSKPDLPTRDTASAKPGTEMPSSREAEEGRERDVEARMAGLVFDRDWLREACDGGRREGRGMEMEALVRRLRGQVWAGVEGLDTYKADASTREHESVGPTFESLAASAQFHLIQSLVSRLIVEHIFGGYFVGLSSKQAEDLSNVERSLSSFGSIESMNQWRSTTLSILHRDSQKLSKETAGLVDGVVAQVSSIVESISEVKHTEARDQSLRTLIDSAVELSRLLRLQKAVFNIMMPCREGHQ